MGEDSKKVVGIEVKVPESLDNAVSNIVGPVTKVAGEGLGNLMYLIFGGLEHRANLKKAKYAHALSLFAQDLAREIGDIPEQKRLEPSTQIVMSALSDAQFCVEEESLRQMFAKLLASSMHSEKTVLVHPSFSDIIRRMTPVDASNLALFKTSQSFPIVKLSVQYRNGGISTKYNNVFLANEKRQDVSMQCRSLECLSMLGLITLDYMQWLKDDVHYKPFYDHPLYRSMLTSIKFLEEGLKGQIFLDPSLCPKGINVAKGKVSITSIGSDFLAVCT